jgi:integrase
MILFYVSTGVRKSALIDLKLKHLKKIDEYGCYKITIYENTKDEYYTFCTPECAAAISSYLEQRKQAGEIINKESYLFRNEFNYFDSHGVRHPRPLTQNGLSGLIRNLLLVCGLRDGNENRYQRHEKAMFHAFRKFFDTSLINSDVNQMVKELLMGHSVGLDNSYYRPNEDKMLTEYMKAVDILTLNEEERLRIKVGQLVEKQDEISLMKLKHEQEIKQVKDQMVNLNESNKEIRECLKEFLKHPDKLVMISKEFKSSSLSN